MPAQTFGATALSEAPHGAATAAGAAAHTDTHVPGHAPSWAAAQHEEPVEVPSSMCRRRSYRHDPYGWATAAPTCKPVRAHLTEVRGFARVLPLYTQACPPYPLADVAHVVPARKAAVVAQAWGLAPGAVVKLAIGQVPYHLATDQIAHTLAGQTAGARLLALEARVEAVPGAALGTRRRTGLWFAYVHVRDAMAFLALDRLVIIRSRDTVVFCAGSEARLYAWCQAKRAQVRDTVVNGATPPAMPLMAMTVRTERPRPDAPHQM